MKTKACIKCGNGYPETSKYFIIHKNKKLGKICWSCFRKRTAELHQTKHIKIEREWKQLNNLDHKIGKVTNKMAEQKPFTLKGLVRERIISKDQERLLRLVHHNFAGMPVEQAATRMSLLTEEVESMLDNIFDVAPQMFPILNRIEHKIYLMYSEQGYTQKEIAEHLGYTPSSVQRLIVWMRSQGMPGLNIITKKPRRQRYEDYMEPEVKERF